MLYVQKDTDEMVSFENRCLLQQPKQKKIVNYSQQCDKNSHFQKIILYLLEIHYTIIIEIYIYIYIYIYNEMWIVNLPGLFVFCIYHGVYKNW